MVDLGLLPGAPSGAPWSGAAGVSADGSVIVGTATSSTSNEAFIWEEANGMRELDQVLGQLGVDLAGWRLISAVGVSADGLTITGSGTNPSGVREPWIAVVPEPGTAALVGLGLVVLATSRRSTAR